MLFPDSKPLRNTLFALSATALLLSIFVHEFRLVALLLAGVGLFLGASVASHANRIGHALTPFVGRQLLVQVWQRALPEAGAGEFELVELRALGAGLLVRLRVAGTKRSAWLKIAQPNAVLSDSRDVRIRFNGYCSWDGKRIKSADGRRAPGTVQFEFLPPKQ